MSGEPPNGFEIHRSDNPANIVTAGQLSDEIRDWIGMEGFLDMRAYIRFRFLDYFTNQLLPDKLDDKLDSPSISEEEMAINALVVDFTLKHKYYFTLCLLISEIQAFSRFDERLKPLLTQISSMSTKEMENLSPLLDREQDTWFRGNYLCDVDVLGFQRKFCSASSPDSTVSNFEALRKSLAADDCESHSRMDAGNDFNTLMDCFVDQITQVKRKVKQIEFKYSQGGLGMRHSRRMKATEIEVRRLREKFADMSRNLEMMKGSVQVLMQAVDQLRMQGQQALQRCAPYISSVLDLTNHIGRIDVAVRRIKRKLTAQGNRSKARAIKRGRLKIRHMAAEGSKSTQIGTAGVLDKTVQTDFCGGEDSLLLQSFDKTRSEVAIQTGLVATADVHTQSDLIHHVTNKEITPPSACSIGDASRERYNTDSWFPKREDDDVGLSKGKRRDNSVQTDVASFQWKETSGIMEQNSELHGKILEQSKRIKYLTARIAQLHDDLAKEKIEEQTHRAWLGITKTDASTNTDDSRQIPCTSGIRRTDSQPAINVLKNVPCFDATPLKKALAAAKAEIYSLKLERRTIQDLPRPNSKNDMDR